MSSIHLDLFDYSVGKISLQSKRVRYFTGSPGLLLSFITIALRVLREYLAPLIFSALFWPLFCGLYLDLFVLNYFDKIARLKNNIICTSNALLVFIAWIIPIGIIAFTTSFSLLDFVSKVEFQVTDNCVVE